MANEINALDTSAATQLERVLPASTLKSMSATDRAEFGEVLESKEAALLREKFGSAADKLLAQMGEAYDTAKKREDWRGERVSFDGSGKLPEPELLGLQSLRSAVSRGVASDVRTSLGEDGSFTLSWPASGATLNISRAEGGLAVKYSSLPDGIAKVSLDGEGRKGTVEIESTTVLARSLGAARHAVAAGITSASECSHVLAAVRQGLGVHLAQDEANVRALSGTPLAVFKRNAKGQGPQTTFKVGVIDGSRAVDFAGRVVTELGAWRAVAFDRSDVVALVHSSIERVGHSEPGDCLRLAMGKDREGLQRTFRAYHLTDGQLSTSTAKLLGQYSKIDVRGAAAAAIGAETERLAREGKQVTSELIAKAEKDWAEGFSARAEVGTRDLATAAARMLTPPFSPEVLGEVKREPAFVRIDVGRDVAASRTPALAVEAREATLLRGRERARAQAKPVKESAQMSMSL